MNLDQMQDLMNNLEVYFMDGHLLEDEQGEFG